MSEKYGTVLVFKKGFSKEKIQNLLNTPALLEALEKCWLGSGEGKDYVPYRLNKFEEKWGGPVWYIP